MGNCISDNTTSIIKSSLIDHETSDKIEACLNDIKTYINDLQLVEKSQLQVVKEQLLARNVTCAKWYLCQVKFFREQIDISQRSFNKLEAQWLKLKKEPTINFSILEQASSVRRKLNTDVDINYWRTVCCDVTKQHEQNQKISKFIQHNNINLLTYDMQVNKEIDIITRGLNPIDLPSPNVITESDI
jgi:hypothetical protein